MWLKKGLGTSAAGVPGPVPDDAAFCKEHPALMEFVSTTAWEDGSPRETGTLLLFTEDGRWKGMLKDKAQKMICFLSAPSFRELLRSAEKGLQTGSLEWRREKVWGKKSS